MSKKLNWLDKFAQDQASKMTKTASLNKEAEKLILSSEDIPNAKDGLIAEYKGVHYKVVNSNYADSKGPGILLEKVAFDEEEKEEENLEVAEEVMEEEVVEEEAVEEEPAEEIVEDMDIDGFEDDIEIEDDIVEEAPVEESIDGFEDEVSIDEPIAGPAESAPEMQMEMGTMPMAPNPNGKNLTDAPEMSRVNPGDVYHIEVRDTVEIDKFEGEAVQTEQSIAQENSVDGTTPEGKFNRILNKMREMDAPKPGEVMMPDAPVATSSEGLVDPSFSGSTEAPMDAPAEMPMEEAPVEEAPVEEVPVEEAPVEEMPVEEEVCEDPECEEEEDKPLMASNRILSRIKLS